MVGATRGNVNRCMRKWQRRGILQLKYRLTIILKPEVLHLIEEPDLSSSVSRPQREAWI
jgi:hypothetical protein